MYERHKYSYQGKEYSLNALAKISGLHRDTILHRLAQGWTIDEVMETPAGEPQTKVRKEDFGKKIPIVFSAPLPVFDSMQPILGKKYIATICGSQSETLLGRVFYMIELENGKRLITYPGEFEELSEDLAASC